MTKNYCKLDIQTIAQICGILENMVSSAYGPRGSKTLLSTETGQVLISSDGVTVLRHLDCAHPIARLIIDSMTRLSNYTGDGSKTFILYLANFIKELLLYEQTRSCFEANAYISILQKVKVHISQNLCFHIIAKEPKGVSAVTSETCKNVIKTCLSNSFSWTTCEQIASMASNVFRKCNISNYNIIHMVNLIVDNFEELCIKVPNLPYCESRAVPQYIIQRKFATFCQNSNNNPRFIICTFPISGYSKNLETKEVIHLKSEQTLTDFMNHHQHLLKKFVDICRSKDINIVLCSEEISEQALEYFQSSEISVVPYVPEEDCKWLCTNLKLKPCDSILENIDVKMISRAKMCRTIVINGRQCVHLDLSDRVSELVLPDMLLICAPTEGLCNQLCLKLRRSYQTLLVGFTEMNESSFGDKKVSTNTILRNKISVIGGGGTFEYMTSDFILDFGKNKEELLYRTCQMLSKALLKIPFLLFKNNSPSSLMDLKRYISYFEVVKQAKTHGLFCGINRFGEPSEVINDNIIEVSEVKIHVLLSAIELIQQLLKLDYVIGVKKIQTSDFD